MDNGKVIFTCALKGSPDMYRAMIAHNDGTFSLGKVRRGGKTLSVEYKIDPDDLLKSAFMVLTDDPDVKKAKGLGRKLAAGWLWAMIMSGAYDVQPGALDE